MTKKQFQNKMHSLGSITHYSGKKRIMYVDDLTQDNLDLISSRISDLKFGLVSNLPIISQIA